MSYSNGPGRLTTAPTHKGTPSRRRRRLTAAAQGGYYVTTGLWPIVHMASFEFVTGRKHDRWLVKTVGLLVTVIGAVQLRAASRTVGDDVRLLSLGSALGLAAVDVVYWKRGVISAAYLLDALAEAGLAAGWLLSDSPSPRPGAEKSPAAPAKVSAGRLHEPGTAPS